jgi:hypothetical protein
MPLGFIKDPQAKLDYHVDWTAWLDGDSIEISTWTVPSDLTIVETSTTDQITTIWLEAGTLGLQHSLINHITTSGGRGDDRSFFIIIRNK